MSVERVRVFCGTALPASALDCCRRLTSQREGGCAAVLHTHALGCTHTHTAAVPHTHSGGCTTRLGAHRQRTVRPPLTSLPPLTDRPPPLTSLPPLTDRPPPLTEPASVDGRPTPLTGCASVNGRSTTLTDAASVDGRPTPLTGCVSVNGLGPPSTRSPVNGPRSPLTDSAPLMDANLR